MSNNRPTSKQDALATIRRRVLRGIPEGNLDVPHLAAINQHLFHDVYPEAGQFRATPATALGAQAPEPEKVQRRLQKRLSSLRADDHLQHTSRREAVRELAGLYVDLQAMAPFEKGNKLTATLFVRATAQRIGLELDFGKLRRSNLELATTQAANGKPEQLAELFDSVTSRAAWTHQTPTGVIRKPQQPQPLFNDEHGAMAWPDSRKQMARLQEMVENSLQDQGIELKRPGDLASIVNEFRGEAEYLTRYPAVLDERVSIAAQKRGATEAKRVDDEDIPTLNKPL